MEEGGSSTLRMRSPGQRPDDPTAVLHTLPSVEEEDPAASEGLQPRVHQHQSRNPANSLFFLLQGGSRFPDCSD